MSLLTTYVVLLLGLPAQLVVAPLGGAGSPAQLVGLVALLWWATYRLAHGKAGPTSGRRLRVALAALVTSVLLSYVAANLRPLGGIESRAADRGLLIVGAWCGSL